MFWHFLEMKMAGTPPQCRSSGRGLWEDHVAAKYLMTVLTKDSRDWIIEGTSRLNVQLHVNNYSAACSSLKHQANTFNDLWTSAWSSSSTTTCCQTLAAGKTFHFCSCCTLMWGLVLVFWLWFSVVVLLFPAWMERLGVGWFGRSLFQVFHKEATHHAWHKILDPHSCRCFFWSWNRFEMTLKGGRVV